MHVNHSYISNDFAALMKKELSIREQFREYNEKFSRKIEVVYSVVCSGELLFKLEINIYGNKRKT